MRAEARRRARPGFSSLRFTHYTGVVEHPTPRLYVRNAACHARLGSLPVAVLECTTAVHVRARVLRTYLRNWGSFMPSYHGQQRISNGQHRIPWKTRTRSASDREPYFLFLRATWGDAVISLSATRMDAWQPRAARARLPTEAGASTADRKSPSCSLCG